MPDKSKSQITVTVTVVAYSNDDTVHACCDSLMKQRYDKDMFDVVLRVLINNPDAVSMDLLDKKFPEFDIIRMKSNSGYAGAILRCWNDANDGIVVVTNDDITFDEFWLVNLLKPFENRNVFASTCSIINDGEDEEKSNGSLNPFGIRIPDVFPDRTKVLFPSGAAFAFRKDEIEPVDASYFLYFEDVYLGLKARLRGFEIVMNPESKAFHRHQLSTSRMNRGQLHCLQEKNRLGNVWIFLQGKTLAKLIPYFITDFLIRLVLMISGKRRIDGTIRAWFYYLTHFGTTLQKRLKVGKVRKVDDSAILRYMSGKVIPDKGDRTGTLNRIFLAYANLVKLNFAEFSGDSDGK